jgi:undecaprenyl-diphosphatase
VTKLHVKIGLLSLALFLVVSAMVLTNASQAQDAQAALAINHAYLGSALSAFVVAMATYGREYFWIPVIAVMLLIGNRNTKLLAVELCVLFVVGIAAGEALKIVVFRPRPFVDIPSIVTRVPTDTDSSFPSGHALIVSIGAAFSLLKLRNRPAIVLFVLEAAVVSYSRVYVGVHYPLDVVAGVLLGFAIVGIGVALMERYLTSPLQRATNIITRILKEGPLAL